MDNEDNDDLLFMNSFIAPLSSNDLRSDQRARFQDYYIRLREQEARADKLKIIQNRDNGSSSSSNAGTTGSSGGDTTGANENDRGQYIYNKTSMVSIDTRDRDKNAFPNQNHFKAFLGHHFQNVQKMQLVSSEFPNTDQVIRGSTSATPNNTISWSNLEDSGDGIYKSGLEQSVSGYVDITSVNFVNLTVGDTFDVYVSGANPSSGVDGFHTVTVIDSGTLRFPWNTDVGGTVYVDFPFNTYTVSITPGNYTLDTLCAELQSTMNLVKRQQGSGPYHYFVVTGDTDTDVITFQSFILTPLNPNPFSTTQWSNVITVTYPYHGVSVGDNILITGVNTSVAGIPYSDLNGVFTVTTVPDYQTFTFDLAGISANATTTGGGSTIRYGVTAPFRLLFNSMDEAIATSMGFPMEDSSIAVSTSSALGPISTVTYDIENAVMGSNIITFTTTTNTILTSSTKVAITSISNSSMTPVNGTAISGISIVTTTAHGFTMPTAVHIMGSNSVPSVDGNWVAIALDYNVMFIQALNVTTSGTAAGYVRWGGDMVRVNGLRTLPSIADYTSFPIDNASGNSFDIPIPVTYIDPSSVVGSTVQTGLLQVNQENHGLNVITSAVESFTLAPGGSTSYYVTTQIPHGLPSSSITASVTGSGSSCTLSATGIGTSFLLNNPIYVSAQTGLSGNLIGASVVTSVIDSDDITISSTNVTGTGTCTVTVPITTTVDVTGNGSSCTLSFPNVHGMTYVLNNAMIITASSGLSKSIVGLAKVTSIPNSYQIIIGSNSVTGTGTCTLYTSPPVVIAQTNCFPAIDNWYYTAIVNSPTTFYLAPSFGAGGISTHGTFGIIGRRRNNLALSRVPSDLPGGDNLVGIPLTSINNVYRDIVSIIDANNYTIRIDDQFAQSTVTVGGANVHVSSETHGMSRLQANTVDGTATGTLYQTVNLSGENYIFLVCPGLQSVYGAQIMYNAGGVADVFAKIMLTGPPGYVLFNTYVTQPALFDYPIATLSELEFYVYKHDGTLFDFNGIDFSFSLEITEILTSHDTFNMSSRSGKAFRARGTPGGAASMQISKPLITNGPGSQMPAPNLRGLGVSLRGSS